jgi:hypothetical protein
MGFKKPLDKSPRVCYNEFIKGKELIAMENFNYNVIIKNNGNEIVIKTNDVIYAIREFLRAVEAECDACLCNGYTGEVLCHNGDEPWCTDEMALMILGYMCAEHWGEEVEDDEPHIVPADGAIADPAVALISSLFGIPADEVVAIHNGEGLPS